MKKMANIMRQRMEWRERACQWHRQAAPVWLQREVNAMEAARKALRSITRDFPANALPEALKLFPFDACMLETFHTLRPREPIDTIYGVPDEFNATRSRLIDQDMAIDIVQDVDVGVACVDVVAIPGLHQLPFIQELYSQRIGFGGVSGLTISARPSWPEGCTVHRCLWFFRGRWSREPTFRECRMLEALNDDIAAAVDRMQLPVSHHASVEWQILGGCEDGYVLLRRDSAEFETNRRAFELSDRYAPWGNKHHETEKLKKFLKYCDARQGAPIRGPGGRTQLIVRTSRNERYGDLALYRFEEISLVPENITSEGEQLLSRLDDVEREIVRIMVTTTLSNKEIAINMRLEVRAFEKRVQRIAEKLNIRVSRGGRVRPILMQLLARK